MHQLTFHPLGNADCCLIDLANKRKILFDFANTRDPNNTYDLRCDLGQELRDDLDECGRSSFDVVAFTHLDEDHYKGATEFFWLDHAKKYQGEDRVKIDTLWVPAAAITETSLDKPEAAVLRSEARHRFRQGSGIRVFSRPGKLRKWCEDNDIDFESRKCLITDAGCLAPEFSLSQDGVEFFVHSPFAKRLNETEVEDRNDDGLIMQTTFEVGGVQTRVWLMADATHETLSDIVCITERRGRAERLEWDVCKLPHHCSYRAIGPEKGTRKTAPMDEVGRLFEVYGKENCVVVSTSNSIPELGSEADRDHYPPHRQAANYYRENVVNSASDDFKVTMDHPKKTAPKSLVISIDAGKATVQKRASGTGAAVYGVSAPRAG